MQVEITDKKLRKYCRKMARGILQKKLSELESELADVIRIPLDPHYVPRHLISYDDFVKRIGFLKNLLSAEEVTSEPQNSDQLHDIAERIAALETTAFHEWNESRNSALDDFDDTLSICSDCTHAILNDCGEAVHESETPVSAPEDFSGEKWPEKCFEEAENLETANPGEEVGRIWWRFRNYFGAFGSGVILGAICMAKLSSMFGMVDTEAFLLPPT